MEVQDMLEFVCIQDSRTKTHTDKECLTMDKFLIEETSSSILGVIIPIWHKIVEIIYAEGIQGKCYS